MTIRFLHSALLAGIIAFAMIGAIRTADAGTPSL